MLKSIIIDPTFKQKCKEYLQWTGKKNFKQTKTFFNTKLIYSNIKFDGKSLEESLERIINSQSGNLEFEFTFYSGMMNK